MMIMSIRGPVDFHGGYLMGDSREVAAKEVELFG